MKFTSKTLSILKNYSGINSSILFKKGNELSTVSSMKNIVAYSQIEEEIPKDFGIYDLPEFLNVLSLIDDPELEFTDDFVKITSDNGGTNIRYAYSSPTVIIAPPEKKIKMPSGEVSFSLSDSLLKSIIKASNVLNLPDVIIKNDGDELIISAENISFPSSNTFSQVLPNAEFDKNAKISFGYKTEYFKFMPNDYDVKISQKLISEFSSDNGDLVYYLGLERNSTYSD